MYFYILQTGDERLGRAIAVSGFKAKGAATKLGILLLDTLLDCPMMIIFYLCIQEADSRQWKGMFTKHPLW